MGIFNRKKAEPRVEVEPERDPDLPMTLDQAKRLRTMLRTEFAEAGREMTVYSDHMIDDQGAQFGLWNLAANCAELPAAEWSKTISEHVQSLTAPQPELADLSEEELTKSVIQRIVPLDSLPDPSWFPTRQYLTDNLVLVLCIDQPQTILTVAEDKYADHGGYARWREVGRDNLSNLVDTLPIERGRMNGEGAFDIVMGESFFTASLAVHLDRVLARVGLADLGKGVLVALPTRHQIALRIIDGPDAGQALMNLFTFAARGYETAAGSISPHVFWVREGQWQQVTSFEGDEPRINIDSELAGVLGIDG